MEESYRKQQGKLHLFVYLCDLGEMGSLGTVGVQRSDKLKLGKAKANGILVEIQ